MLASIVRQSAVRSETRLDEAVKRRSGGLINGNLFAKAGIAKMGSRRTDGRKRLQPLEVARSCSRNFCFPEQSVSGRT